MSSALPLHSSIAVAAVVVTELDLRHLPAPEPMQRALDATEALLPGQSVSVLTPMVPTPLLEMLAARGLLTTVSPLAGGAARVLIHCPDPDDAS